MPEQGTPSTIRLREFKADARRLLPRDHPLLKVLRKVPDALSVAEFIVRVPDWIAILGDASDD